MASLNKVILIGNLGSDPEVRHTANNQMVATFNIATTEKWTGKTGEASEKTEWHRIVVWGKLAEICKEYLSKGRQVYIEGRLQTRQWDDKEGKKRSTTEIVAQNVQFLGSAPSERNRPVSVAPASQPQAFEEAGPSANTEDDIPF